MKTHNDVLVEACVESGIRIEKGKKIYDDLTNRINTDEVYVDKEDTGLNIEYMQLNCPDLLVSL